MIKYEAEVMWNKLSKANRTLLLREAGRNPASFRNRVWAILPYFVQDALIVAMKRILSDNGEPRSGISSIPMKGQQNG